MKFLSTVLLASSSELFQRVIQAAPDAINIGGKGTGRDTAQTYQFAGSKDDKMSLRVGFYDKDVGDAGWELHGDVALSVVDGIDKSFFEMGWCYKPFTSRSNFFDCLHILFYYDHEYIGVGGTQGFSENFKGYDVYGPKIYEGIESPKDFKGMYTDSSLDLSEKDQSGVWIVNTAKSYKQCPSVGNCVFNAHFRRNFNSTDASDYALIKGDNIQFEAYGYAAQYRDYRRSSETTNQIIGDTQNIYLERLTW